MACQVSVKNTTPRQTSGTPSPISPTRWGTQALVPLQVIQSMSLVANWQVPKAIWSWVTKFCSTSWPAMSGWSSLSSYHNAWVLQRRSGSIAIRSHSLAVYVTMSAIVGCLSDQARMSFSLMSGYHNSHMLLNNCTSHSSASASPSIAAKTSKSCSSTNNRPVSWPTIKMVQLKKNLMDPEPFQKSSRIASVALARSMVTMIDYKITCLNWGNFQ